VVITDVVCGKKKLREPKRGEKEGAYVEKPYSDWVILDHGAEENDQPVSLRRNRK